MSAVSRNSTFSVIAGLVWIGYALVLAGCGGGGTPSGGPAVNGMPVASAAAPSTPLSPRPVALPKEPEAGPTLAPLSYEAKDRRDPFVPVSIVNEKSTGLAIDTLKVAGIIRGRTLLALVETPDGLGYILKPGDVLGDGRVTDITPNSVSFAVTAKSGQGATTVTRRLRAD